MPKGYVVANIEVENAETFKEFVSLSGIAVEKYNGRVLVRNPAAEQREGKGGPMSVVVEFDDIDTARRFYESPEYTVAKTVRQSCAVTNLVLVEGV